ncbi:MAG: AMP-binding protein, partial [Myxococcales bacterium]|nr:AMP-binding protein [Myxococcales bacterium]
VGVGPGDPVACFLPMSPEAAIALLATARVGGLFVPIFSGFGTDAIAARLADARPKVLFTADGVSRRGGIVAMKETADAAVARAGANLRVGVVDYVKRENVPWSEGRDVAWSEIATFPDRADPLPVDCEAPLLLGYTSGTTGKPKGILLPHGGASIKIIQEGAFQLDFQPDDTATWVTDMGWIMGPWLITAGLGNGATIALIDGAPDFPDPGVLWRLVDELGITALGVSPTLVRVLASHGDEHVASAGLETLRTFGSTGEVWNPSPWWWLFETVGGGKRPIINMSGGTEVGACFLSANVLQGLKPCSVGGPSLGMAMDVWSDAGSSLRGEVGELVCTAHWPGATRGFFGDRERYLETYWSRWPDVWVHGDWASIDPEGFWFLHGRSDDTLNIAGKRIGPAEIEDAAVAHAGVAMAAAIGVPDSLKGEVIVTYIVPAPGVTADAELIREVEAQIVSVVGKAFRPKRILAVPDLPRTRSQKIMRRVIKALSLGREPGDLSSMENPESLEYLRPLDAD